MQELKNLLKTLRKKEVFLKKNGMSYDDHILLIDIIFELEYVEYWLKNLSAHLRKRPPIRLWKTNKKLTFYLSCILLHLRILRDILDLKNCAPFEKAWAIMNRVIAHPSLWAPWARRLYEIKFEQIDIYIEYCGNRTEKFKWQDDLLDNAHRTWKILSKWTMLEVETPNSCIYIWANQFAWWTMIFQEIIHPIINIIDTKYR